MPETNLVKNNTTQKKVVKLKGMFESAHLSLSTDISTCETVWESLWKWHVYMLLIIFIVFPYLQVSLWKQMIAYMKTA